MYKNINEAVNNYKGRIMAANGDEEKLMRIRTRIHGAAALKIQEFKRHAGFNVYYVDAGDGKIKSCRWNLAVTFPVQAKAYLEETADYNLTVCRDLAARLPSIFFLVSDEIWQKVKPDDKPFFDMDDDNDSDEQN